MVKDLSFESRVVAQRASMRVSGEELAARAGASGFGDRTKALLARHAAVESTGAVGYALFDAPPVIVRGENAHVFDADGRRYIDMLAGFSVSNIGHGNPAVLEAIARQSEQLVHYFDFPNEPRVELAERLAGMLPGKNRVAFAATGAEAVDLALKAARWYTGAPQIVTAYGGYHGTTSGTMSLTAKGGMWGYFYPVGPHDTAQVKVPFSYPYRSALGVSEEEDAQACLDYLYRMFRGKETPMGDGRAVSNVAAILVEPMQGSAGYIIPGEGFLRGLRQLCDEFGILLIFDEIQTGMGRSGKMWAHEYEDIVPDILITSKGLASGLPLSAVIAREEILSSWGPGAHVSTFAATPLACATALATLDYMDDHDVVAQVAANGEYFKSRLDELAIKHELLGSIDARGLFVGLELVKDRDTKEPAVEETSRVLQTCVDEGLLFEKGGYYYNRLQLIPPLTIERETLDDAIEILDTAFTKAQLA